MSAKDRVAAGFRMTELGPLPEEWEVVPLGSLVSIHDKKRIPLNAKQRAAMRGAFPYYGANGRLDHVSDYIFEGEYVLVAEDGGYWGAFDSSAYLVSGKFWVNNHAHVLQAIPSKSVNDFLTHYLNWADIARFISGTTRGKLNQGVLTAIPVACPSLPEQRRIAAVLDTIRQAIEATDRVIAAARELKKSLMRHLFTYGPVPIHQADQVPLKDTEIGPMPEGWQVAKVFEIGEVVTGTTPRTSLRENYDGPYMFICPGDISEARSVKTTEKTLTEQGLRVSRVLPQDSVLVVCIGATIGKTAMTSAARSTTNQQINAIIPYEASVPLFVYYAVTQRSRALPSLAGRAAVPILNKSNFSDFFLPTAPRRDQEQVADALAAVDNAIGAAQDRKSALESLFKTMLHLLMTGRVRVKDWDIGQEPQRGAA